MRLGVDVESGPVAEDRAEFESRTKALIAQYDEFSPVQLGGSHHIIGALTIIVVGFGLSYTFFKLQDRWTKGGIRSSREDEIGMSSIVTRSGRPAGCWAWSAGS